MCNRFVFAFLLVLGLKFGAFAAHAATADYAGTYSCAVVGTAGKVSDRFAFYGKVIVKTSGTLTLTMKKVISGATKDPGLGKTMVQSGHVSSSGVVTILSKMSEIDNLNFVKSGSTVIGLQGTFKPGPGSDDSISGIFMGLAQSLSAPQSGNISDYAGNYSYLFLSTSGPTGSRDAIFGTVKVSATGTITLRGKEAVSGDHSGGTEIDKIGVRTAKVSAAGVATLTGSASHIFSVHFVKSGSAVVGLQGTFKPKGSINSDDSGILIGLKQP